MAPQVKKSVSFPSSANNCFVLTQPLKSSLPWFSSCRRNLLLHHPGKGPRVTGAEHMKHSGIPGAKLPTELQVLFGLLLPCGFCHSKNGKIREIHDSLLL